MRSELNVYKASAGSGKTFRLAAEYIKLLMTDASVFRRILAVTFTNKATEEMKTRILYYLWNLSHKDCEETLMELLMHETGLGKDAIRERATESLGLMLHDYGRFRVETIDAFFQQVLRNLGRELKIGEALRLEVNDVEAMEVAVDELLDELSNGDEALGWIVDLVDENIKDEKRWNIVRDLKDFGKKLLEDSFRENEEKLSIYAGYGNEDDKSRKNVTQRFSAYRRRLEELGTLAEQEMASMADAFDDILKRNGLTVADFKNKERGAAGYFGKLRNLVKYEGTTRNTTIERALVDGMEFLTKQQQADERLKKIVEEEIHPLLKKAEDRRERCVKILITSRTMRDSLGRVRLLTAIDKKMKEINDRNNVFLLSDTQEVLSRLIDEGDSPFIFEKIGSRLEHIMIDEFQDTSRKQWENFLVLLKDCMANGGSRNLIVGDVKQSIYRWREGDWKLLNDIEDFFKNNTLNIVSLKKNYRSDKHVIDFNNAFFNRAVELESHDLADDEETYGDQLRKIYSDVCQTAAEGADENGYVKVELVNSSDVGLQTMLEHVAADVHQLKENGEKLSDIAIIVRRNSDIRIVVDYLTSVEPDLPLVTAEALLLSSSVAVNIMIDALRVLLNKEDEITLSTLIFNYQHYGLCNKLFSTEILIDKEERKNYLPIGFEPEDRKLLTMPLMELMEYLFHIFNLERFDEQSAYVCYFFDCVNDFIYNQGGNVNKFIRYWDETLWQKSIQSDTQEGVNMLTVHKSKGLEFKHVLAPFCDWQLEKEQKLWLDTPEEMQEDEYELSKELTPLPINYSYKKLKNSYFKPSAEEEHFQNRVDNLNMLYVLFTRAKQSLRIYGREMKSDRRAQLINDTIFGSDHMTELLKGSTIEEFEDGEVHFKKFEYGESVPTRKFIKNKEQKNPFVSELQNLLFTMKSYPFKGKYRQSNDSQLFVNSMMEKTEKTTILPQASYINEGLMLHSIFAQIKTLEDIPAVIEGLKMKGISTGGLQKDKLVKFIEQRLHSDQVAKWFSHEWKVMNECSIICRDSFTGQVVERRPDRVLQKGNEVIVIDFKFGKQDESYHSQVREYMHLLRNMGHEKVKGYLWYIYQNIVEEVKFV